MFSSFCHKSFFVGCLCATALALSSGVSWATQKASDVTVITATPESTSISTVTEIPAKSQPAAEKVEAEKAEAAQFALEEAALAAEASGHSPSPAAAQVNNTAPQRSGALTQGLNTPAGIVQWLLSTIGVLGVIFLIAFFLKKSRFVQRSVGSMRIEGQLSLGPKERLVKVQIDGQRLLLGVTSSQINLLKELDPVAETPAKKPAAKLSFKRNTRTRHEPVPAPQPAVPKSAVQQPEEPKAPATPEPEEESFEDLLARVQKDQQTKNSYAVAESAQLHTKSSASAYVSKTGKVTVMPEDDVLLKRSSRLKRELKEEQAYEAMPEEAMAELANLVDLQHQYAQTTSAKKGESDDHHRA